jgi:hypothetical protein
VYLVVCVGFPLTKVREVSSGLEPSDSSVIPQVRSLTSDGLRLCQGPLVPNPSLANEGENQDAARASSKGSSGRCRMPSVPEVNRNLR